MGTLETINDLDYLTNHWKHLHDVRTRIINELPFIEITPAPYAPNCKFIKLIQFSQIDTDWDIHKFYTGKSFTLQILADKLSTMIEKGRSVDIYPMIQSIANNTIKKHSKDGEFLGYGHFRWDFKVHTLNKKELDRLKEYFNLS